MHRLRTTRRRRRWRWLAAVATFAAVIAADARERSWVRSDATVLGRAGAIHARFVLYRTVDTSGPHLARVLVEAADGRRFLISTLHDVAGAGDVETIATAPGDTLLELRTSRTEPFVELQVVSRTVRFDRDQADVTALTGQLRAGEPAAAGALDGAAWIAHWWSAVGPEVGLPELALTELLGATTPEGTADGPRLRWEAVAMAVEDSWAGTAFELPFGADLLH